MEKASLFQCVHGMIWKTCNSCKDKSESAILAELNLQKEEQKQRLIYDYQEPVQGTQEDEADLAYDLEDMGM